MKILFILLFTISSTTLFSQVTTSTSAGSWDTPGNWSNGVPANGGIATISHAMVMDKHITVFDGNYTVTNTGSIIDNAGGSEYNFDIRGTGILEVSGKIVIGGDFEIRNFSDVILNGCDSIVVRGDADFQNSATLSIANCAALLVAGNLDFTGSFVGTIDGNIQVDGEMTGRNSASLAGTGLACSVGATDYFNSASAFGSSTDCNSGPCCFGTGSALPIDLLNFSAIYASSGSVRVLWETSSELNNDYFTLEHSTDGINFIEIERIIGAGNSNGVNVYSALFEIELSNDNYFRLKQIDFNGSVTIYNVIKLDNHSSGEFNDKNESQFTVFPNPGNGTDLAIRSGISESFQLIVENIKGEVLYDVFHTPETTSQHFCVDLPLYNGVYFITYKSNSAQSTLPYIVK